MIRLAVDSCTTRVDQECIHPLYTPVVSRETQWAKDGGAAGPGRHTFSHWRASRLVCAVRV